MSDTVNFAASYREMRGAEGGFANVPGDPGGPTYAGVALATVRIRDANGDGVPDFDLNGDGRVDILDIRDELPKRQDLIREFYRTDYWIRSGADRLPWPFCLGVFDCAVLYGPAAAGKMLQRALQLTVAQQDGVVGPRTVAAAERAAAVPSVCSDTWTRFRIERVDLARRISSKWEREGRPKPWQFFNGWRNRAIHIETVGRRPPVAG